MRDLRASVNSDFPVITRHSCCRDVSAKRARCCFERPFVMRSISIRLPSSVSSGCPEGGAVDSIDLQKPKCYIRYTEQTPNQRYVRNTTIGSEVAKVKKRG